MKPWEDAAWWRVGGRAVPSTVGEERVSAEHSVTFTYRPNLNSKVIQ